MSATITLTASDGFELAAYLAVPDGVPRGGVVVIQEIFGVNVHIRDVADGYSADGYIAIAPALFDRLERGVDLGYTGPDIEIGRDLARGRTDFARAVSDTEDAASLVRTMLPASGKVGCVGYCWGGVVAAASATSSVSKVDASVSYYGSGTVSLIGEPLIAPLLCHYGDQDTSIPPADIDKMRGAWPSAEVFVYPAQHGFNCDRREQYDPVARELARTRTLEFFGRHLG